MPDENPESKKIPLQTLKASAQDSNGKDMFHWDYGVKYSDDGTTLYINVLKEYCKGATNICEIGSGASTQIFIEEVKKRKGHVWSIDVRSRPYVTNHCTYINEDSLHMVWAKDVDVLYIDGNHKGEHVKKELISYCAAVRPGGIILMDDVRHPGVPTKFLPDNLENVVSEFCWLNGLNWKYCADAPNKIVVILVHKWLGHGK